ncbi:MAG: NFYB/HAP3 family transcription factor subunit [Planctomycetes bacterium]|nr:NFYB/HAP3 family transcription factor subunit [Planctomycetota bacterium]
MSDLPNAAIKRILLANGVPRISASSVGIAADAAQDFLVKLAKGAVENMNAAKRKTVMDEDIQAAKAAISSGRLF